MTNPFLDDPNLSTEQKIRNVANVVLKYTTLTRDNKSRKGKQNQYAADKQSIVLASRQLAEMVLAHLPEQADCIDSDDQNCAIEGRPND